MTDFRMLVALVLICTLAAVGCDEGDSGGGANADGGMTASDAGDSGDDGGESAADAGDAGVDADTSSDASSLVTVRSSAYATSQYYNPGLQHDVYSGIIILSAQDGTCADAATFCDGERPGRALIIELGAGQEYSTGAYEVNEIDDGTGEQEPFTDESKFATVMLRDSSAAEPYIWGSIMVRRYDAAGIEGVYVLHVDGTTYSQDFSVDSCESFDAPRFGCSW